MKNKKFMSRLFSAVLAGAMVLSMVPAAFAASAEEPAEQTFCRSNHEHTHADYYGDAISNNDGKHHYECTYKCTKLHFLKGDFECDNISLNEKCTYENGVCTKCNYEDPDYVKPHDHWDYAPTYKNNEDGTHDLLCGDCGEAISKNVTCNWESGKCACGSEKPEEPAKPECKHEGEQKLVDNGDGSHNAYCSNEECGELMSENIPHYFVNGKCACGAEEPEEPAKPECKHEGEQKLVDNGNGSHNAYCSNEECGELMSENIPHYFIDGKCACGAEEPACDHMCNNWSYVNNEDGTHDVVCADCEETVTEGVAHYFIDGKCICGAEKAVCDHMGNHWKYENKGETHDVICVDCGKTVTADMAHYFIDGKCICGAEKAEDAKLKTVAINFYSEDEEKQIAEVNVEVAADATYINTSILTAPKGYEIAIVGDLPIRDGYVYVVVRKAQSTCDHMANDWSYVNNGDGTHNVVCNACEEVVTESIAHYFIDGKCICGAEEVVCDHMGNHWTYTNNGNGTHKVVCADCGETVTEEAECNYESGECICGSKKANEKPAEKPEDKPGQDDTKEPTTPSTPSTSTSNKGTSILGGLLESAGLFSFFRILFKALFHI